MSNYNGWTNYPTWNLALWINNEEILWRYWNAKAHTILAETGFNNMESKYELASAIRNWTESNQPEQIGDIGAYSDIMTWALQEINYEEIYPAYDPAAGSLYAGRLRGHSRDLLHRLHLPRGGTPGSSCPRSTCCNRGRSRCD